jgi:hypothetical protein
MGRKRGGERKMRRREGGRKETREGRQGRPRGWSRRRQYRRPSYLKSSSSWKSWLSLSWREVSFGRGNHQKGSTQSK